jgi:DNA polymerase I-like protein with 3'-5' exonuclease and polymerase domains
MKLAIDTETTGSDFYHGCKPFYVSTCTDSGVVASWVWDVDPFTRIPNIVESEIHDIVTLLESADEIWLQNSKFDIAALRSIGIDWPQRWWDKTQDTLIMSHLIDSLGQHGLKALSTLYLLISDDDEKELAKQVNTARKKAQSYNLKHPDKPINIANPNHPMFPGSKTPKRKGKEEEGGWWALDMWLPAAMKGLFPESPDSWLTICQKYADMDAIRTIKLSEVLVDEMEKRGLRSLYEDRRQLLQVTYEMETFGIPIRANLIKFKTRAFEAMSEKFWKKIDGDKVNPNSPKQLQQKLFVDFGLPVLELTKSKKKKDGTYSKGGTPSTKEEVLKQLELVATGDAATYLSDLMTYKKINSAITYLNAYHLNRCDIGRLRSRYNITGTQTTRFSASLVQNVGKREDMNLRDVFGPEKGHWWISADFVNIELIVAATIAGESEMLDVFRRGESYHILIASAIYPEELETLGESGFKKINLYRRVKSGNYAIQYGAQEKKADWTYGRPGAFQTLRSRFNKLFGFSDSKLDEATQFGYVKTLSGYPLVCPTQRGRPEPTKPFSYWCQGTVGDIISRAMLNIARNTDFQMIMQVHDELVFDFDEKTHSLLDWYDFGLVVQKEMQDAALYYGVQVPVDVSLHTTCWRIEDDSIKGRFL